MFCENCKKEWKNRCGNYISNVLKSKSLDIYVDEYKVRRIINGEKNDILLLNYLADNNLLQNDTCYLRLACKLLQNKNKEHIKFFIYYLKKSFGYPYDKNNILMPNMNKDIIRQECFCNIENWKNSKCHKYNIEIMRDDGTLYDKNNEIYLEIFKDYISITKNDKILVDFIKENCGRYELCYKDIAIFIMKQRNKNFNIFMRIEMITFIFSYLYWSFGHPFNENNILYIYFEDKWMENVSVMHEELDKMKKIVDKEEINYQEEINNSFKNNNNIGLLNYEYKPKSKKQSNNIITKSGYIRDARVRELALQLANFQCEIDKVHDTFISNTNLRNYVESHHFIPMKYYDKFEFSIDNEANIIALCPNCHRCLHLGRFEDKAIILEKLYYKHIENLRKADIEITLNRLLKMYKN